MGVCRRRAVGRGLSTWYFSIDSEFGCGQSLFPIGIWLPVL